MRLRIFIRGCVHLSVHPSVRLSVRYAFVKTAENGQFCRESALYPWEGHKLRFRINRSLIQSRIQSLHLQTSVTHGCYFEALSGAPKDPKLGQTFFCHRTLRREQDWGSRAKIRGSGAKIWASQITTGKLEIYLLSIGGQWPRG